MASLACIPADEFEEADFSGSLIDRSRMLGSAANRGDVHYELSDLHAHCMAMPLKSVASE